MKGWVFALAVLWTCVLLQAINAVPLTDQILHYESLSYDAVGVHQQHDRIRRNVGTEKEVQFSFNAFGRDFGLSLWHNRDVFAPGVVFEHVTSEGPQAIPYDMGTFYRGQVRGDPMSTLSGHIINGVFDGVIRTGDEVYYVELAKKFKRDTSGYHSVIYRLKDVLLNTTESSCGLKDDIYEQMKKVQASAKPLKAEVPRPKATDTLSDMFSSRRRRSTSGTVGGGKYCQMLVAADDLFVQNIGGGNTVNTVNEIASIFADVQFIYSNTDFFKTGQGSGITPTIVKIQIISPTDPTYSGLSNTGLAVTDFLNLWSTYNHDSYCLAMLLTYRTFSGGVLGLAWVAAPPGGNAGGICQTSVTLSTGVMSLNTAIVTFQNYGARVARAVSIITVTHEIGHNFGSPHDTVAPCIPGSSGRGNYIMYFQATDGSQTNNNKFSTCSISSINSVITTKSSCFSLSGSFCGNGIKEAGEQCDCGTVQDCSSPSSTYDPCCNTSQTCKYKTGANCSVVDPCCSASTCTVIKNNQTVCFNKTDCAATSMCNGVDSTCPTSTFSLDGTLCNSNTSTCLGGVCSGTQCAAKGLADCQCTDTSYQCHLCCMYPATGGTCQSTFVLQQKNYLPNGIPFKGENLATGKSCDNNQGYCSSDSPPVCKVVNNENVLKGLLDIFNPANLNNILIWLTTYWWVPVIVVVAFLVLMALLRCTYRRKAVKRAISRVSNSVRRRPAGRDEADQAGGRRRAQPNVKVKRLTCFFPSADLETIEAVLHSCGNSEDTAVQRLLSVGYPLKKIPIPSA